MFMFTCLPTVTTLHTIIETCNLSALQNVPSGRSDFDYHEPAYIASKHNLTEANLFYSLANSLNVNATWSERSRNVMHIIDKFQKAILHVNVKVCHGFTEKWQ